MEAALQIVITPSGELTDRDRDIIGFERQWWKYAGAKEQAIRELFDMSATRYYQVLNALIDNPIALEADPMLLLIPIVRDGTKAAVGDAPAVWKAFADAAKKI